MSLKLSPRVKVLAAAGIAAVIALAGGSMLLGGSPSKAAPAKTILTLKARHLGAAHLGGKTSRIGSAKPAALAPKPAAKPAPSPVRDALAAGLPARIAQAFASHRSVVVAVYASDAHIDQLTLNEAARGAGLARAGFVAFKTTDPGAIKLPATLGVMADPSVLVFQQGGKLFVRFDGYADSAAVAQAAVSAAT